MLAYEINVQGMQELQAQLARAPGVVIEELEATVTEADLLLTREVKENMPTAHGTLRASVFHEERVNEAGVVGLVGSPLSYIVPVELGTKPHFPPIEPLIDWVKVKFGISGDKAARGAAFAVARKIAMRGTKEQRPFGRAFQSFEPQIRAMFDRAMGRIAARLGNA